MDSSNRNKWVAAAFLLAVVLLVLNYFYEAGKLQKLFHAFTSVQQQAEPASAVPALEKAAPAAAARRPVTWKEYNSCEQKWLEKQLASDYEKYGERSSAWDAKAQAYFITYARFRHGENEEDILKKLKQQGEELLALGCADPYISYIQANVIYQLDGAKQALPLIKRSRELVEESSYPAINQFHASRRLQLAYEKTGIGGEDLRAVKRRKMTFLGQAAADPSFAGGNQRYYMEDVLELWPFDCRMPDEAELLLREVENTPGADPWIKLMVQGLYHNSKGWEARGGEFYHFVKDKDRKKFENELQLARSCFTKAHALHPEFPEAATLMIAVCMASGEYQEERQWFDRAVAAHFDYLPAYERYFWALRPRWGGSHEQMMQFGIECLKTKRFDTEVPRHFLAALWQVGSELEDWREPYRAPGAYEHLKVFFAGMEAEPNQATWSNYWKSIHAIAAWAAGRYEDAEKIIDELDQNFYAAAFGDFNVQKEFVLGEISLRTGALQESFLQAEKLYDDQLKPAALPYYEVLRESMTSDSNALVLINDRIAALTMNAKILKGGWVDLMPEAGLPGWENKGGTWAVEADGTLKGSSNLNSDQLLLLSKFSVEGNYEIRGELEAAYKGGIAMGYVKKMTPEYVAFSIETSGNKASLGEGFYHNKSTVVQEIQPLKKNRFLLSVADGRITAYINDVKVFSDQKLEDRYGWSPHGGRIGLGELLWRVNGYSVKFSDLQLRRIGG